MDEKLLPKDFEAGKKDLYPTRKIEVKPTFYFSKNENRVKMSIDSIERGDVF